MLIMRSWPWPGRQRDSAGGRVVTRPRSRVRARPTDDRATWLGARGSACGQAEAVGRVEQQLLQLARQVAVPYQGRRGRQLTLTDANGNHPPGIRAGRRAWLCRSCLGVDAVTR